MSNFLAYGNRIVGGGGNSQSGGHIIENSSGVDLEQRDTLQFTGSLKTTDDSTNGKTIVDDSPTELTWTQWNALTPAQQAAIPKALITDCPGAEGTINANLLTKLWENPNPTSSFAAQTITLSSDNYDLLLVEYAYYYDSTPQKQLSVTVEKGTDIYMTLSVTRGGGNNFALNAERTATWVSNTQFSITDCYYQPTTATRYVDNTIVIPISFYGIKKTINVEFSAIASDVSTSADKCIMSDGVTSIETALEGSNARIEGLEGFTLIYRGVIDDLNNALDHGFYAIDGTATNIPAAEFAFGNLVVLGGYIKTQIAFSNEATQRMAIRKSVIDTWRII